MINKIKIKNSPLDNEKFEQCQKINNHELENFDFSKVIVKKPWGHEYLSHKEGPVSIWILNINEGTATSMHCHQHKKTSLILLSGQAELSTLSKDKTTILNEGDGLVLDKKVFHSTKALLDGTTLMEVEIPSIKTDLVRLSDRYGRKLKGYELQNEMSFDFGKDERILLDTPGQKQVSNVFVSIENLKDNQSLWENINSAETLLLLSGKMFNQKNNESFSVGDVFKIDTPQDIRDIRIDGPVKILKIRKNEKRD